jgi:hypothetical protein
MADRETETCAPVVTDRAGREEGLEDAARRSRAILASAWARSVFRSLGAWFTPSPGSPHAGHRKAAQRWIASWTP